MVNTEGGWYEEVELARLPVKENAWDDDEWNPCTIKFLSENIPTAKQLEAKRLVKKVNPVDWDEYDEE
jgi:hypothetical protein